MGCCHSLPRREENGRSQVNEATMQEQQPTMNDIKKPETSMIREASSAHSNNTNTNQEKESIKSVDNYDQNYPILVRFSNNGQDVTVQLPTEPPYLTIAQLRKQMLPHFNGQLNQIKFIYLGRVLSDQFIIVPSGTSIVKNKSTVIQMQQECVIHAMVTKRS
ncbi:hypothetical protein BCV72DRAFT_31667 [Rhizopus microsporus var. microsporus]|nr:hypothetical protein BCV72DRAFT_31667 [Rhizopus microsporus var. microsporus]